MKKSSLSQEKKDFQTASIAGSCHNEEKTKKKSQKNPKGEGGEKNSGNPGFVNKN